MAEELSHPQKTIGDLAPRLTEISDDLLYGEIWERPGLSKRDRSLITVAALTALYRSDQLDFHLGLALKNGMTTDELVEAFTHLAFYAGWPTSVTAITHLRNVLKGDSES